MIEALNKQSQLLINPSPAFYNQPMAQLARPAHAAQLLRQGVLCEQRRRSE
ncbi:MAG: N-acetylornithine aminotransferase (EC [uncultured Paraburkholderia sp.]|nr:MAG: N-acetylornithine aminotransferase (EC [uncultured Paraburkholderia sp.]CAH2922006.1 MAG: N-acetylornithine aminotransferase (EC [uncultured Paraburkholderia sp.]